MTTVEILKKMVVWILENTDTKNPTEVARAAGLNPVSMSKIRNGKTKRVKPETLRAVNAAYGNVFNPEWLRGESDVMLAADICSPTSSVLTEGFPEVQSPNPPDYSSLINAALAAKDETIAEKDAHIDDLRQQVADLRHQVAELRAQLAAERGLSTGYPFAPGVADPRTQPGTDV